MLGDTERENVEELISLHRLDYFFEAIDTMLKF